jgi:hypothetical protein
VSLLTGGNSKANTEAGTSDNAENSFNLSSEKSDGSEKSFVQAVTSVQA